jgi:hypothetical protein
MHSRTPWLIVGIAAFALASVPGVRTQSSASSQTSKAPEQSVTVTGCITHESDYRRSADAGRGGPAGTGIGVGNEFVLTNAMMASASSSSTPPAGAAAPAATGTSGRTGTAYELTGSSESKAASFVGKRVEITGMLKAETVGATGAPTGGPTAKIPGSQDLKLRELEISSINAATGTCSTTP